MASDAELLALYALKHHPYRAFAYQTNAQSVSNNTTIHMDTIQKDPSFSFNTANGVFLVPVTGYYLIFHRWITSTAGNSFFSASIVFTDFNGVQQQSLGEAFPQSINSVGISPSAFCAIIVPCLANTGVWAQAQTGTTVTTAVSGNNFTVLQAQLLSVR